MNDYYAEKLKQISNDSAQVEALNSMKTTVVIAGPGSGKTTVLTLKVMQLLDGTIQEPRGLACLTYSTEAARVFKERLSSLGLRKRKNVFLGTVHSFCLSEILIPFSELYPQYGIPVPIRIISEKEKRKLFNQQNYDGNPRIEEVDKERTRSIPGLSKIELESYQIALKAAIDFETVLVNNGFVDYISMVKASVELVKNEAYVQKALESKFPWLIIDEYQDLGKPLHELVLTLLELTNIKILAVGDVDQSIYDFQGAAPDYLIELGNTPGISVIHLLNNYRSSQGIVDASQHILKSQRGYRACGALKDYHAELEFFECSTGMSGEYEIAIEQIRKAYEEGTPYHEIAVFVSSNKQVAELAVACKKEAIPVYVARPEFRVTELILWLRDCADWVVDKYRQSFDSIVNVWIAFLNRVNILSSDDVFRERRKVFTVLLESQRYADRLQEWLDYLDQSLGITSLFGQLDYFPDELDNFNVFFETVRTHDQLLSLEYLVRLGVPENQVVLSTRHSSKGLEFDVVVLLGMEKDSFPSYYDTTPRKLAEARRLCFVSVSRARIKCILVRSTQLQNKYGKWFEKQPSPFWVELRDFQKSRDS